MTACLLSSGLPEVWNQCTQSHCKSRTKISAVPVIHAHGARLICLVHHSYSSCAPFLLVLCPDLPKPHEISFKTPDHLFSYLQEGLSTRLCPYVWQPCMQLFNQLNKNTVPVLSHMIPNLLSLLISLAITCSIHTPQVFPSLLHKREKSGISITIASTSSQLHFNITSVRVS